MEAHAASMEAALTELMSPGTPLPRQRVLLAQITAERARLAAWASYLGTLGVNEPARCAPPPPSPLPSHAPPSHACAWPLSLSSPRACAEPPPHAYTPLPQVLHLTLTPLFRRSYLAQVAVLRAAAAPAQLARRLATAEVLQQAQAERLALLVAKNRPTTSLQHLWDLEGAPGGGIAGFFCVHLAQPGCLKPWLARVWRGGKTVHLGMFATAEEAALCVARSPEGQAAAAGKQAADRRLAGGGGYCSDFAFPPNAQSCTPAETRPPPLTSKEARQQAQTEGLTLRVADNNSGYYGVYLDDARRPHHFKATVRRGDKQAHLGSFASAEEAALCVARSPEGQAAALIKAAAGPVPPMSAEELQQVLRKRQRTSEFRAQRTSSPQLLQFLSAHAAAKTARAARESGKGCHARAPSSLPHGGRPERRNSGIHDDAEEEVDEATAMVTIEVLDAVAVHEGDAHHHEALVVEAALVGEWRSWKPGFQRFE